MPIDQSVYTTRTLMGLYQDMREVRTFWSRFFPSAIQSEDEFIQFSKMEQFRKLAPFVMPTSQGRPIYERREAVQQFKPAYIKMTDTINATAVRKVKPGFGEMGMQTAMTPYQRYQMTVADMMQQHRDAVQRRIEWMCAEAVINGSVTVQGEGYPTTTVDYSRDANHRVTLAGTDRWHVAGGSEIQNQLEDWINLMGIAKHGAAPRQAIMGHNAWRNFSADAKIIQRMDTNYRDTSGATFDLGVGNGDVVQYKGQINGLDVYVYRDTYEAPNATYDGYDEVEFLSPNDLLLIAPEKLNGVIAYGAIQDLAANLQPVPIFPKMWESHDPSATMMMTQSAPLPIIVNPNATMRITTGDE